MTRDKFFKIMDKMVNGTMLSWNGMDFMKVTETIIENITMNTRYFKGLDF